MTAARDWLRRHVRVVVACLVALLLAVGAIVFAGWHFSSAVLVPSHKTWNESVEVLAVEPQRIVLERSDTSLKPGFYGLTWNGGHAVVGPILAEDENSVIRRLRDVRGYLVAGLTGAGLESKVFSGNPRSARGLPFSTVAVDGELGEMPAWLVPARSDTWAIVVHGINDNPQVGLRIAPTLRRLGLPALYITYRDDLGAPSSPDGLHHMGETEWRDLQAAARYARAHGARRLVLVGYSMGGALVGQLMQRSPLAARVSALVLDAPALNWKRILEFNAAEMGLPSFTALPVEAAIGIRIDPDWDSLDMLRHSGSLQLPILLFHGGDDEVVPLATSEDLAADLPQWVRFYRVPDAGHTQSWNVDPGLYQRRLRAFLAPLFTTKRARPLGSGSK